MVEKSDKRKKSNILLAIVVVVAVFLVWNRFFSQKRFFGSIVYSNGTLKINISYVKPKNNETIDAYVIEDQYNMNNLQPSYIDMPSQFPRMTNSGVFPLEGTSFMNFESAGRGDRDMNNVAILMESTNWNDTSRLVRSITAQRKSEEDLKIFLYSPTDQSGVTYEMLKSWTAPESNVLAIPKTDRFNATFNVLRNYKVKYVVRLSDYMHIGDDFAEFYLVGKHVMEVDRSIHAVCGTSNGGWQDKALGDVLWLSETPCENGEMVTMKSSHVPAFSRIWIRPEFARVGFAEVSVTQESPWNIDRFNPLLMRQAEFSERFDLDMTHAEKRSLEGWIAERTSGCLNDILMFPYESDEDLKFYFTNTNLKTLHKYKGIATLSIGSCRMFIVPKKLYEENYNYY